MLNKNKQAFTLIELLVTVTIIGILSSVAIYGLTSVRQKAQDTSHLSNLRDLQLALEAYRSVNGKYPDASTQGTANYITNLAPAFIKKLPVNQVQTASLGYQYAVSADKKTYCVYIRSIISKPESQSELYTATCPKTWVACRGPAIVALTTCSGI